MSDAEYLAWCLSKPCHYCGVEFWGPVCPCERTAGGEDDKRIMKMPTKEEFAKDQREQENRAGNHGPTEKEAQFERDRETRREENSRADEADRQSYPSGRSHRR